MADGHVPKKRGTRETHPAFSRDRFEATPEFARFKDGMRALLAVPKSKLDELVKEAKEKSPRIGNPKAPGQKSKRIEKGRIKAIGHTTATISRQIRNRKHGGRFACRAHLP